MERQNTVLPPAAMEVINQISGTYSAKFWDGLLAVTESLDTVKSVNDSIKDDDLIVVKVTKANVAQKGVIKISKTGEVFSTVTANSGIYQPVYEVRGLPGAVFEITAAEDIYTPDGTLRYSAGQVVDTVTSDKAGNAVSKSLYLGKYKIREVTAPAGMIASKEVQRTVRQGAFRADTGTDWLHTKDGSRDECAAQIDCAPPS
ncbi:MAG: hypothetical protein HDT14_06395 [Oscillibacter sp.]|nr:hypothetical protein [Oscillibacter sp.]